VDALLPGGALIDQRLAETYQRAQLEDVRRRDPRLRQLAGKERPQLQIAVGVVGLRPSLAPAPGRRLGRIGEMRAVAGPLALEGTTGWRFVAEEIGSSRTTSTHPPRLPSHCGHVARRDRRDGTRGRPLLAADAPLHRGAPLGDPRHRNGRRGDAARADRPRRRGAEPDRAAQRLPLPTRCPYATEICSEVRPPLADFGDGRYAACHHPLGGAVPVAGEEARA
jgi:hypothetical protein